MPTKIPSLQDSTLIVFGHGSSQNATSGASVLQHSSALAEAGLFKQVLPAFWKQPPALIEVLAKVRGSRVFIVPLFISEGYFSEVIVPKALGLEWNQRRATTRAGTLVHYCRPVGTHPAMTAIILGRACEIIKRFPFPCPPDPLRTTLFIAGHGTSQNDNSRRAIEMQVDALRTLGDYAAVHPVFIEEDPRIGDVYSLAGTRDIVLVPYFISDGLHVAEDIPVLLGESAEKVRQRLQEGRPTWKNPTELKGKRIWYSESVGSHPKVLDIILERVTEFESQVPPQTA